LGKKKELSILGKRKTWASIRLLSDPKAKQQRSKAKKGTNMWELIQKLRREKTDALVEERGKEPQR